MTTKIFYSDNFVLAIRCFNTQSTFNFIGLKNVFKNTKSERSPHFILQFVTGAFRESGPGGGHFRSSRCREIGTQDAACSAAVTAAVVRVHTGN